MADKWADYLISAVRYNLGGTHIDAVMLHKDQGNQVGAGSSASRQEVVALLDAGSTVGTFYKDEKNEARWGAAVRVVTIEGQKYIRTDRDATKADNLGNLPRF